jgi:hypothetical protein
MLITIYQNSYFRVSAFGDYFDQDNTYKIESLFSPSNRPLLASHRNPNVSSKLVIGLHLVNSKDFSNEE